MTEGFRRLDRKLVQQIQHSREAPGPLKTCHQKLRTYLTYMGDLNN
jgi:hypothetical protein